MNFLVKIEEAVNKFLLMIAEKFKALLPHFLFEIVPAIKKIIPFIIHWFHNYLPKVKILLLKTVGYGKHYITSGIGLIKDAIKYLRSDEFKHNKAVVIKQPFLFCAKHPVAAIYRIIGTAIFSLASFLIFTNIKTVIVGTTKLRAPASAHNAEFAPENEIELKNHKFEIALKSSGGGHGGGGGNTHRKEEIIFDIIIETSSKELKEKLEKDEKLLDAELEAFEFNISGLPVSEGEKNGNEKELTTFLNHQFLKMGHEKNIIKKITLRQSPKRRPAYFGQEDRMYAMTDITLQIFLEDTSHNRQVYFNYSVLASNRNIILFFKDNELKIRDRLSTQVEPILPRLPIEDEGKSIIKDKIRYELNEMLKEEKIEGHVLEVYLDYIMGT